MLKLESSCLAKYNDGVWYEGVVVEVPTNDKQDYQVMFEEYEETITVGVVDIIPWGKAVIV